MPVNPIFAKLQKLGIPKGHTLFRDNNIYRLVPVKRDKNKPMNEYPKWEGSQEQYKEAARLLAQASPKKNTETKAQTQKRVEQATKNAPSGAQSTMDKVSDALPKTGEDVANIAQGVAGQAQDALLGTDPKEFSINKFTPEQQTAINTLRERGIKYGDETATQGLDNIRSLLGQADQRAEGRMESLLGQEEQQQEVRDQRRGGMESRVGQAELFGNLRAIGREADILRRERGFGQEQEQLQQERRQQAQQQQEALQQAQAGGQERLQGLEAQQQARLGQVQERLAGPFGSEFAPIAEEARGKFQEEVVPSIAERFTSLGGGRLSSPAFARQLGEAGSQLERGLAAEKAKFGIAQRQQDIGQQLGLLGQGTQESLGQQGMNLQQYIGQRGLDQQQQQQALQNLQYLRGLGSQEVMGRMGLGLNERNMAQQNQQFLRDLMERSDIGQRGLDLQGQQQGQRQNIEQQRTDLSRIMAQAGLDQQQQDMLFRQLGLGLTEQKDINVLPGQEGAAGGIFRSLAENLGKGMFKGGQEAAKTAGTAGGSALAGAIPVVGPALSDVGGQLGGWAGEKAYNLGAGGVQYGADAIYNAGSKLYNKF